MLIINASGITNKLFWLFLDFLFSLLLNVEHTKEEIANLIYYVYFLFLFLQNQSKSSLLQMVSIIVSLVSLGFHSKCLYLAHELISSKLKSIFRKESTELTFSC